MVNLYVRVIYDGSFSWIPNIIYIYIIRNYNYYNLEYIDDHFKYSIPALVNTLYPRNSHGHGFFHPRNWLCLLTISLATMASTDISANDALAHSSLAPKGEADADGVVMLKFTTVIVLLTTA